MSKPSKDAASFQHRDPLEYESGFSSSPHDPFITLASHILRSTFGPAVQSIADVVQVRGELPLSGIMSQLQQTRKDRKCIVQKQRVTDDSGISNAEIRAGVAVLLQHGCLIASAKKKKSPIHYRYNPSAALRMLQYARYVDFFYRDPTRAACLQELFLVGRSRTTDLVVRVANASDSAETGRKAILEALCQLVEDGFVSRAPEISKEMDEDDDKDEDEFQFDEQPKKKKAKLESSSDPYKQEDSATVALMQNQSKFQTTLPMDAVWRVNASAFLERQRANALGKLVAERHGHKVPYAGLLVVAALKYLSHEKHSQHQDVSSNIFCVTKVQPFLPKSAVEGLEKKKGGIVYNLERSFQELAELERPAVCRRSGDTLYEIRISSLVQYLHQRMIYQIVHDRHGAVAARVMSILLQKGFMESERLASEAMVPAKDMQEVLNRLYLSDYLRMMMFSPRQYNPNHMTFLWGFEYPKLVQTVTGQAAQALLNIRLRRDSEAQVGKLFLDRAKQAADVDENENQDDKEKHEKFILGMERLDVASQQLEDTLVCFLEFRRS